VIFEDTQAVHWELLRHVWHVGAHGQQAKRLKYVPSAHNGIGKESYCRRESTCTPKFYVAMYRRLFFGVLTTASTSTPNCEQLQPPISRVSSYCEYCEFAMLVVFHVERWRRSISRAQETSMYAPLSNQTTALTS
jgi:hypothetical protein